MGEHSEKSRPQSAPAKPTRVPEARVLPEARRIGSREVRSLCVGRKVFDAVQVEFLGR